jgi:hypothetical protein
MQIANQTLKFVANFKRAPDKNFNIAYQYPLPNSNIYIVFE